MNENKHLKPAISGGSGGRFVDIGDTLLPLFNDPDGRGTRRWREMFGLQCPVQPALKGIYFNVSAAPQSSSDY